MKYKAKVELINNFLKEKGFIWYKKSVFHNKYWLEATKATEEDFNKKDDSDKSNNHILKIDKYEIPLDEDDYEDLINRIKQHLQTNGVLFGFYKQLKG